MKDFFSNRIIKLIIKLLKIPLILLCLFVILLPLASLGLNYYSSPNITNPVFEHAHIRFMLEIEGQKIDFSKDSFQQPYEKGQCDGVFPKEPMHFHDGNDQFLHLHWADITGGQVLKYYGLNYIGKDDNSLGYNFTPLIKNMKLPEEVKIHGKVLPKPSNNSKIWVYSGYRSDNGDIQFSKLNSDKFITDKIESSLSVESRVKIQKREIDEANKNKTSFLQNPLNLFSGIKVLAHNGIDDGDEDLSFLNVNTENSSISTSQQSTSVSATSTNSSESNQSSENKETSPPNNLDTNELKNINNLLGNISIFIQENEPNAEKISDSYANLKPLSKSTCGG